jgi:hypothetical protein
MRKKKGYALVTILVIGLFSIAFLLALAGIVTSAVRVVSANKWSESLRNAAEIGIDYAVNQYNSQPGGLDPTNPGIASSTTTLPETYLQTTTANSGVPNVTVTITSTRLINTDTTDWGKLQTMSSIYSPQLDPTRTTSANSNPITPTNVSAPGGGYRIITSTATNGIYSRSIQVILKARFDPPPGSPSSGSPLALPLTTPQQSLFTSPLFSNGALALNSSSLLVQGYNTQTPNAQFPPVHTQSTGTQTYAAYNLNIITNTSAQVAVGNTVVGDVTVSSNSSGSNTVVQVPGLTNGGTIDGRVISNGIVTSSTVAPTTLTAPTSTTANVLANADTVGTSPTAPRQTLNETQPVQLTASSPVAQTTEAPVPSSATAQSIPSLSEVNAAGIPLQGANVQTGASGNYGTTGLTTSGATAPVNIANGTTNGIGSPVSFFVQDSGTGQAVNLNTQLLNSANNVPGGDPRNLQIYYQGTDAVTLNIGSNNFTGIIYAPNAPVTIQGNGNFYGGIAAGSVNITLVGQLNLATDLTVSSTNAPPGWAAPMAGASTALQANTNGSLLYQNGPYGPPILGWQPVTWQEF